MELSRRNPTREKGRFHDDPYYDANVRGHRVDPSRGRDAGNRCVDGRAHDASLGCRTSATVGSRRDARQSQLFDSDGVRYSRTRREHASIKFGRHLRNGRCLGFPGSDRRRPAHRALGITSEEYYSLHFFLYRFLLSCHQRSASTRPALQGESRTQMSSTFDRRSFLNSLSCHNRWCRIGRIDR